MPGVEGGPWFGLFAPAGTPRAAIDWINAQAIKAFSAPDLKPRLTDMGLTIPLGTPEDFGKHVSAETQRWGDVIRKGNIKMEHRPSGATPQTKWPGSRPAISISSETETYSVCWIADTIQAPPPARRNVQYSTPSSGVSPPCTTLADGAIDQLVDLAVAHRDGRILVVAFAPRLGEIALQQLHVADLVDHAACRVGGELLREVRQHLRRHAQPQRADVLVAVGGLHFGQRALECVVVGRLDLDRLAGVVRGRAPPLAPLPLRPRPLRKLPRCCGAPPLHVAVRQDRRRKRPAAASGAATSARPARRPAPPGRSGSSCRASRRSPPCRP